MNLTLLAVLIVLIITGVWVWKRLSLDTQDYLVDQAVPMAASGLAIVIMLFILIRTIFRRRTKHRERAKLLTMFERETTHDKRRDLAFSLLEINAYRIDGLEQPSPP